VFFPRREYPHTGPETSCPCFSHTTGSAAELPIPWFDATSANGHLVSASDANRGWSIQNAASRVHSVSTKMKVKVTSTLKELME
jgi:hypothetical protein